MSRPLRVISQEMSEFEFHISPVRSSSRPQTGVGTWGTSSSSRRARSASALRAVDRLRNVGDDAVTPAPDLVAERSQPARHACPHCAFGDDAAVGALTPCRCLLDHEPSLRRVHLERGVVEIATIPVRKSRGEPLEDPPVETNRMTAGAERQPVQVDRTGHG